MSSCLRNKRIRLFCLPAKTFSFFGHNCHKSKEENFVISRASNKSLGLEQARIRYETFTIVILRQKMLLAFWRARKKVSGRWKLRVYEPLRMSSNCSRTEFILVASKKAEKLKDESVHDPLNFMISN